MNSTTETSTTNIDEITQLGNERDEYLLKRKQLMTDYLDDVGDKSNKIQSTRPDHFASTWPFREKSK